MKNHNEKAKFQYKLFAGVYDLMDLLFVTRKGNPRLGLARHIPNEELSILDVCFGTGNSALAIARKNDKNKITGIDLSLEMLAVARRKIKKKRIDNITLHCMDATHLDLQQRFDIVTTSLSLHEMPPAVMEAAIGEMSRVLKPGGSLYIIEWNRPSHKLGAAMFNFFPYRFEPRGFGDFLKIDWGAQLKKSGISVDAIEAYTFTKLIIAHKTMDEQTNA
ncbi:MAG: class I SAM-dependent methyltransferase [Clostridia bacterium]|nr:class I SAM-dependent methyltransferase [Clostridia bacterium]